MELQERQCHRRVRTHHGRHQCRQRRKGAFGEDELTKALQAAAGDVFGREVAIFPVTTGTAANALALSHLVPHYAAVYLLQRVDANEVFVSLPEATVAALEAQSFGLYRWPAAAADGVAMSLVASYATPRAAVDDFLAAVRRCN